MIQYYTAVLHTNHNNDILRQTEFSFGTHTLGILASGSDEELLDLLDLLGL
jgi:hypothetical protein